MLVETVKKYYEGGLNLNCAETILYAANEEYNLNLAKETLKTMAGFGGGIGVEEVCGTLIGAVAVLGIMFTKVSAHESDRMKKLSGEFYLNFKDKLGTENCCRLKSIYRNEEDRCLKMVTTAAEILDFMVKREGRNNGLQNC